MTKTDDNARRRKVVRRGSNTHTAVPAKRTRPPENKQRFEKVGEQTMKDGRKRDVLRQVSADRPPCKGCGKEPRRNGSSYGEECSKAKKVQDMNDRKLAKRIAGN